MQSGLVAHASNSRTFIQEAETEGSRVQGQLELHSEFKTSLYNTERCSFRNDPWKHNFGALLKTNQQQQKQQQEANFKFEMLYLAKDSRLVREDQNMSPGNLALGLLL